MRDRRYTATARIFRENYEGKKCKLGTFLDRVYSRLEDFETAINPNLRKTYSNRAIRMKAIESIKKKREKDQSHGGYSFIKQHSQALSEKNKPNTGVDIMMSVEEAEVYHRMYRNKIKELEDRIYGEENYSTVQELDKKLNDLIQEYNQFLIFNPISSGTK